MSTRRPTKPIERAAPTTIHERLFYILLVVLAFLAPFKFGLPNLDMLPNPNFTGPAIASLLQPLEPWATEIAELLIILAAFFWLLDMIVTRRLVFRTTRADVFLWAFLAVGLVSSFFALVPHSAVAFMKEFGSWVLFYHLVVNMRGGERRERVLLTALVAGIVCVSFYGLHQYFIGYEQTVQVVYRLIPPEQQSGALALLERGRVMGTFASPNSLGGLYALTLPLVCLFALVMRQWTRRLGAWPTVAFILVGPLVAFAVFILTESKGAFLSAGLVSVVAALTMYRRLKPTAWKLTAVLGVAIAAAVGLSLTAPGRTLLERGAYTFEERIGYWRGAARMAADRPLTRNGIGSGFNAFGVLFPKYKDPPDVVGIARNAHNNYVQLFIEVGVLGLAAFVLFWIVLLARAGPVVRAVGRGEPLTFAGLIVIAAFFGLLGFLLHSLVDFDLYVPSLAMTAMLLAALLARHTAPMREHVIVLHKEIHAVSVLAILMLITGPLMLFVPMPLTAEIHYFNATALLAGNAIDQPADPTRTMDAAIGEMHAALRWDPLNQNYMAYLGGLYARRGLANGNLEALDEARADLDEAEAWYTRALRRQPVSFQYFYRRALVRLERTRLSGTIDWELVLDDLEEAVACFPTDSFMRLVYARFLDEAGRADDARLQFTAATWYDDNAFTRALQSARERYNTSLEIEQFAAAIEHLRATYSTQGK